MLASHAEAKHQAFLWELSSGRKGHCGLQLKAPVRLGTPGKDWASLHTRWLAAAGEVLSRTPVHSSLCDLCLWRPVHHSAVAAASVARCFVSVASG